MLTKECPSCLADVPTTAFRCKHCFHDFNVKPSNKSGGIAVLWSVTIMSVIGAVSMALVVQKSLEAQYFVDKSTENIHAITTTMTGGTESSTIPFADIESIEFVTGGDEMFYEVFATTTDDERLMLQSSDERNLRAFATQTQLDIDERTDHAVELIQIDNTDDI